MNINCEQIQLFKNLINNKQDKFRINSTVKYIFQANLN